MPGLQQLVNFRHANKISCSKDQRTWSAFYSFSKNCYVYVMDNAFFYNFVSYIFSRI